MLHRLADNLSQLGVEFEGLLTIDAAVDVRSQVFKFFGGEFTVQKPFQFFYSFVAVGHGLLVRFR
ncbi:MAG: hypothetical protein WC864_10975 [Ilumatobacteraceae bacterium]